MTTATIAPSAETLVQMPIRAGGVTKLATFKIVSVTPAGPALAADMTARGWEPVTFICERVTQGTERAMTVLAQRSAKSGQIEIIRR